MQTFSKKKIALAVGASLLVMASAAQATAPAAPTARSVPVLVTPASQANANSLYGTTGFTGTLPVNVYFTAPADTTSPAIAFAVLSAGADGLLVNAANNLGTTTGASVATDDIAVYAGTAGASQINLRVPTASVAFTANANTASAANAAFSIVVSGTEALRIVAASGVLEYTTDITAASPTWLPVSVAIQAPSATNAILATDSTAAPNTTPIAAVAGQAALNTVAPTPTVKTRATAGLVDGVVIDTITPLTGAPVVNSASAALTVTSNIAPASATDFAVLQTAPATGVTSAVVAGATAQYSVVFGTPLTVDWTTGNAAADAAVYTAANFNTGVTNAFTVAATATAANQASYANVYTALGVAAKLASLPAATDGANPSITKAEYDTFSGRLILTISEPSTLFTTAPHDSTREVAENVFVGTAGTTADPSLAALALNNDLDLSVGVTNASGLATLTITDLNAGNNTSNLGDLVLAAGKVTVSSGIALKETNDSGYSSTTPALDTTALADVNGVQLRGGVLSNSGVIEGASGTGIVAVAAQTVIDFDGISPHAPVGNTIASAQTSNVEPDKIAQITVKFETTHEIAFGAGKTAADLVGKIRVTVFGDAIGNGAPQNWQFFPTASQMAISTAGDALTITLPTALIYANIGGIVTDANVEYLDLDSTAKVNGDNLLVGKNDATVVVQPGNVDVSIPLVASSLSNTLYTQNITGTLTGAANGSLMRAYIAKWIDQPVAGKPLVDVSAGRITMKDDRLVADLALDLIAGNTWAAVSQRIQTELNKTAPQPIQAWIHIHRSNDAMPTATGDSGGPASGLSGVADQRFLDVRAALGITFPGNSPDKILYEVKIDPVKGTITSPRIAGLLTMNSRSTTKLGRGLQFLDADGNLTSANSPAMVAEFGCTGTFNCASTTPATQPITLTPPVVAEGQVGANGAFNMIVGTDAKTPEQIANMKDTFLLLVNYDPTTTNLLPGLNIQDQFTLVTSADKDASNFVPFEPNLITLKGVRTDLSTIVAPATTAPVQTLAQIHRTALTAGSNHWELIGMGNLDRKAPLSNVNLPRFMVGLDPVSGYPISIWTGDVADYGIVQLGWPLNPTTSAPTPAAPADMAFSMLGNKSAVVSQGTNGDTVGAVGVKPNAVAFAFSDDDSTFGPVHKVVFGKAKLAGDDVPTGVPANWSLVSVPTAWTTTLPPEIGMIINVGAQADAQYTWVLGDATTPTLEAGQPVFVYTTATITGN